MEVEPTGAGDGLAVKGLMVEVVRLVDFVGLVRLVGRLVPYLGLGSWRWHRS